MDIEGVLKKSIMTMKKDLLKSLEDCVGRVVDIVHSELDTCSSIEEFQERFTEDFLWEKLQCAAGAVAQPSFKKTNCFIEWCKDARKEIRETEDKLSPQDEHTRLTQLWSDIPKHTKEDYRKKAQDVNTKRRNNHGPPQKKLTFRVTNKEKKKSKKKQKELERKKREVERKEKQSQADPKAKILVRVLTDETENNYKIRGSSHFEKLLKLFETKPSNQDFDWEYRSATNKQILKEQVIMDHRDVWEPTVMNGYDYILIVHASHKQDIAEDSQIPEEDYQDIHPTQYVQEFDDGFDDESPKFMYDSSYSEEY